MTDPMAEIRASFFIECEELLESLQDALLLMEDGNSESETINIVFRAVHSIKGGAGAFGLDDLVHFAHHYESAMDEVRAGNFTPDSAALKLFFKCADTLADLVRAARDGDAVSPDVTRPLLEELAQIAGSAIEEAEGEDFDFQPATLGFDAANGLPDLPPLDELAALEDLDDPAPTAATSDQTAYQIHFQPDPALFATGNEPLYLLRALRDLGDYHARCEVNDLPAPEGLSDDQFHLSWVIDLKTEESEKSIREVFEFVDGLCQMEIRKGSLDAPVAQETALSLPPSSVPEPTEIPTPIQTAPETDYPPATVQKTSEPRAAAAPTQPRATVRVDLDRIDRLVNLVGELVINQAMLNQSVAAAGLPPNSPISTGLEEFLQLTRDIQESVMMIRAQPIKSLFQRMGRIVRETSATVGKDVRLQTIGEATEVDKTVIERLADPLTHMIRNAVDHGLETPENRRAAGKADQGTVQLSAQHRSGRIVIEISDDGAGINRERVRQIAIEKKLIAADAVLTDSEIDNLLFQPGFSTAKEVSNLSGRGVGMDVVKSSIQSLGGRISIQSTPGKGSTFTISLPLTLAVLDGMVVKVADETLVVPLNTILETLTLTADDLRSMGPSRHVVQIRGGFVPLLDLGTELAYRDPKPDYVGGIVLLIGQEDGNRAALVVDAIEEQRQVVIKGLEDTYGRVPGIAAATILGDGQIALILDPGDLISTASGRTRPSIALAG